MALPAVAMRGVDLSLGRGAARVHILRDVGLTIGKGEAVGIVGPSGSGKSTLLMIMAGLERPDRGEVEIDGVRLGAMNEDALARFRGQRIGIVFQSFHLIRTMTALENVAAPLELAGRGTRRRARRSSSSRLVSAIASVTIPAQLSGGEQQRVALARALCPRPSLLIADEPTGNLDDTTGRAIVDLIFDLPARRGATLALVTHDTALAARCDRVIRMRSGKVEETPAAVSA